MPFSFKFKILTSILFLLVLALIPASRAQAATIQMPGNNLGLVGYWSFNEGTGTVATDFSGNGNTGTLVNGPAWVNGKHGKALSFDGSSQHVDIGAPSDLELYDSFTLSAWVRNTSSVGGRDFVLSKDTSTGSRGFGIGDENNKFYLEVNGGQQILNTGPDISNTAGWHHITVTKSGMSWTAYVDGASIGNITITNPTPNSGAHWYISGRQYGGFFNGYQGQIDDVRIYNRALSGAEVATLYGVGQTTHTNSTTLGLVGHWTLDEGSGSVANDSSGQGNTGTLNNSPAWVAGKFKSALSFDGTNQYVSIGNAASLQLSTGTASAWVKSSSCSSGFCAIVLKQFAYGAFIVSSGDLIIYDWGNGATRDTGINIADGKWHHIAFSFQDGVTNGSVVYLDGLPVLTTTIAIFGQDTEVEIGRGGPNGGATQPLNGSVDDVRIYNRALTPAEVSMLYNETAPSSMVTVNASQNSRITNGLVGLWSFDGKDMSTTTAFDRSGQGNDGTLTNGPAPTIGKIGQALKFDGVNQYVQSTTVPTSATDNWTMSAWIKASMLSQDSIVVYNGTDSGGYGFGVGGCPLSGSNLCGLFGGITWINSGYTFTDYSWHHVVMERASGVTKFYVDGVQTPNTNNTAPAVPSSAFIIGHEYALSRYFSGSIDDVRIYNRALSAAEVKQLYLMGK
jgi:hypothetical protein